MCEVQKEVSALLWDLFFYSAISGVHIAPIALDT